MENENINNAMFNGIEIIENANLKEFCTFHIGGRGSVLFPKDIFELKRVIRECERLNLRYFILGNGSNLLFPDYDLDMILISLKYFNQIKMKSKDVVYAEAGVPLFALNIFLKNHCLGGFEWSFGIPASVGGMVFMNAGAFSHSVMENVDKVKILKNGKVQIVKREDIDFSYRKSNIEGIILGVFLKFFVKNIDVIAKQQQFFLEERKKSQPFDKFSAGSVFKRENDFIPAKAIDLCGLKGLQIGGAEISKKHAGFIINNGDAKQIDVLALIKYIEIKLQRKMVLEIIVIS